MRQLHAVMDFLLLFSVLFFLLSTVFANQNQGIKPFYENLVKSPSLWIQPKRQPLRSKRSTPHRITECVFVTSEENFYYYKGQENSNKVCGIYLFTDPDKVIEVQFEYLNVPCTTGGLISFFDGWELNGKFFPGIHDHEKPFLRRYKEFCGVKQTKQIFVTAQNAGMVHYQIPDKGKGFSLYVKFHKNPTPCNILVESKEDIYTLRNYGKPNNCTLIAVFPAKIKVLALDVGVLTRAVETGTISQCREKKVSDGLQIGGSENLDPSQFVLFEELCGLDSTPETVLWSRPNTQEQMHQGIVAVQQTCPMCREQEVGALVVGCEVSVVRLVSSGRYGNSATFSVGQPNQIELLESTLTCEV